MKKVLLSFCLLFFFAPFAQAKKSYRDIQTFATDKATQPYIVLGQTAEKARDDEACVRQMAKKAAKKGGDALINIEVNATGAKGMWFGESVMHCKSVVVRWAQSGEKGMTSLDPNTPIPFIFK